MRSFKQTVLEFNVSIKTSAFIIFIFIELCDDTYGLFIIVLL
jgi:hypothetical protein